MLSATAIAAYVLLTLPRLALAYTTIDDAADSASRWSSGQFAVLVDVRRTEEWDAGHLPNATFIPSLQTSQDTSRLAGCESCAIAVYCRSGRRSKEAAVVLENAGFTNVYDVLGINQWTEEAGVTLVSDEDREPSCCDATCTTNEGACNAGSVIGIVLTVISTVVLIATA